VEKATHLGLKNSTRRLEKGIAEENKSAKHFRSAEQTFLLAIPPRWQRPRWSVGKYKQWQNDCSLSQQYSWTLHHRNLLFITVQTTRITQGKHIKTIQQQ